MGKWSLVALKSGGLPKLIRAAVCVPTDIDSHQYLLTLIIILVSNIEIYYIYIYDNLVPYTYHTVY